MKLATITAALAACLIGAPAALAVPAGAPPPPAVPAQHQPDPRPAATSGSLDATTSTGGRYIGSTFVADAAGGPTIAVPSNGGHYVGSTFVADPSAPLPVTASRADTPQAAPATPVAASQGSDSSFDWGDAALGAATMLGRRSSRSAPSSRSGRRAGTARRSERTRCRPSAEQGPCALLRGRASAASAGSHRRRRAGHARLRPPRAAPAGREERGGPARRLDAARPGDLGEQPGRGDHVAGEEDAVAAVDRRAGRARSCRDGRGRRCGRPSPGAGARSRARASPASAASSSRSRRSGGLLGALAGTDRHLRLHQLLAVRGRATGRRALKRSTQPASSRSETTKGSPRRCSRPRSRQTVWPLGQLQRVVAEQLARASASSVATITGDAGSAVDAVRRSRSRRRARARALASASTSALQPPMHVAGGGRRVEQRAHGARPDEGGRQLARIVVEGVDAGGRGEHRRGPLVGVVAHPAAEVAVDGRLAAAQAQHRRDRAQRRRAADLALPAKADRRRAACPRVGGSRSRSRSHAHSGPSL